MDRENCLITYLRSDDTPSDIKNWSRDCYETNSKYQQNRKPEDRKAHHYVISFPIEDIIYGLTAAKAHHAAEEFCKKNFPGYQRLIATHTDTDNLHVHIVINSVRDLEVKEQPWMIKAVDGSVKPSQYEAGKKHTNHSAFRLHLMKEVDSMCKENGFVMENYSDFKRKSKARKRMEYMHDSVMSAAKEAKDKEELKNILKEKYKLTLEIRGQAIRIYHPDLQKPKRIEHIGLTPYDLTKDLYGYYEKAPYNYVDVHKQWEEEEREYQRAYLKQIRLEEERFFYEEEKLKRKGWKDKNGFHYYVSHYDNDGRKRGLLEEIFIFAHIVITKEVPDYVLSERQKEMKELYENRNPASNRVKESKLHKLKLAQEYVIALDIETPAEAKLMAQDESLPLEIRKKAAHVCVMLERAIDKAYCYGGNDHIVEVIENEIYARDYF